MNVSRIRICGSSACLAVMLTAPPPVTAGRINTHATGICQAAVPVFETAIRKRPLSVVNEGSANVFLTCSLSSEGDTNISAAPFAVSLYTRNTGATAASVKCTGVNGLEGNSNNLYAPKTLVVQAGSGRAFAFTTADFGGGARFASAFFSVSCLLPPGTAITDATLLTFE